MKPSNQHQKKKFESECMIWLYTRMVNNQTQHVISIYTQYFLAQVSLFFQTSKHHSAGAISSAQQCTSLSPSITHQPAIVKYTHANERFHSPTSESWATIAVSVGACSESLHMQPLRRFQQHKITENIPRSGVVPAAPGAGLEAVTTLTRQRGWAERQKSQRLMTRDRRALGSIYVGSIAYRSLLVNLSFTWAALPAHHQLKKI